MKYICTSCNYIFDEFIDDGEDNIDKVDDETMCPACYEYGTFQGIEEEVNYANDINKLVFHEIEHIPQIELVDEEANIIKVFVGQSEHPMGDNHRLYSISLYDEYGDLITEEFLSKDADPIAEFDVSDFDEYEIRIKCSLHGVWGRKIEKE